jgi:protein-tyrosine phosphatase
MKSKLLFLCTGNYYRSRFAEMLFNHLVQSSGASWAAESRGIATETGGGNIGPISTYVLEALRARAVVLDPDIRFPLQLHEHDLTGADLIIALDALEHRPLMAKKFPHWLDRIHYWNVPDLYGMTVEDALSQIEKEVQRLLQELANKHSTSHWP